MSNKEFLSDIQSRLASLYKQITTNYFEGAVTGSEYAFEKSANYQFEYEKILSEKDIYLSLQDCLEDESLSDIDKRVAVVLYNESKGKQIEPALLKEMIDIQTEIEKDFTEFRVVVNGKKISDNDVENVLSNSNKTDEVKEHWEKSKEIGSLVSDKLLKLVKLRNKSAKDLGYDNYHSMQLTLNEIDPRWLLETFDKLDDLTRPTFEKMKAEIDNHLSEKFALPAVELMPWHYSNRFFQEPPAIYPSDLDIVYADVDIHSITKSFYNGIGLNIDQMSAKSDLYEKDGKNQHAFCIDLDREEGDIRVLCNIVPSQRWMDTDLHEFGHAVYDFYMDRSLPWALMTPSHILTTEAIAMLFGRLATNTEWIRKCVTNADEFNDNGTADKDIALSQITFSRWAQVMYRFEKSMYENPEQDLQALWWKLVSEYQLLSIPKDRDNKCDWAAKIHIATVPCYYHNYLLGELYASQLQNYINTHIINSEDQGKWVGDKKIGDYLISKVFNPGKTVSWDKLIEDSTGEKLNTEYYTSDFC